MIAAQVQRGDVMTSPGPRRVVVQVFTMRDESNGDTGLAFWVYDPETDRHEHVRIDPEASVVVDRIGGL